MTVVKCAAPQIDTSSRQRTYASLRRLSSSRKRAASRAKDAGHSASAAAETCVRATGRWVQLDRKDIIVPLVCPWQAHNLTADCWNVQGLL